jgi:hypothetical protein
MAKVSKGQRWKLAVRREGHALSFVHESNERYLRPSSFSAFAPLLTIALFGPIASFSALSSTSGRLALSFSSPELDRSHFVNWPFANGPAETM